MIQKYTNKYDRHILTYIGYWICISRKSESHGVINKLFHVLNYLGSLVVVQFACLHVCILVSTPLSLISSPLKFTRLRYLAVTIDTYVTSPVRLTSDICRFECVVCIKLRYLFLYLISVISIFN
jgi:hypothetical protein